MRPHEVGWKDLARFASLAAIALGLLVWWLAEPPLSADERALTGRWYVARPGVARVIEFGRDRTLRTLSRPYVRFADGFSAGEPDASALALPDDGGPLPIEPVGTWQTERGVLLTQSWFPQNARPLGRRLRELFVHRRWPTVAVTQANFRWRGVDADEIELELLPAGGPVRAVRVSADFAFADRLLSPDEVKTAMRLTRLRGAEAAATR